MDEKALRPLGGWRQARATRSLGPREPVRPPRAAQRRSKRAAMTRGLGRSWLVWRQVSPAVLFSMRSCRRLRVWRARGGALRWASRPGSRSQSWSLSPPASPPGASSMGRGGLAPQHRSMRERWESARGPWPSPSTRVPTSSASALRLTPDARGQTSGARPLGRPQARVARYSAICASGNESDAKPARTTAPGIP